MSSENLDKRRLLQIPGWLRTDCKTGPLGHPERVAYHSTQRLCGVKSRAEGIAESVTVSNSAIDLSHGRNVSKVPDEKSDVFVWDNEGEPGAYEGASGTDWDSGSRDEDL